MPQNVLVFGLQYITFISSLVSYEKPLAWLFPNRGNIKAKPVQQQK